jgi:colanic acid biosynthesis glycosyl transferase WcaI
MPSKILGMMASAKPSIVSGNTKSEVANIIQQSECGYYFSDSNPQLIYDCMLSLSEKHHSTQMGEKARKYVTATFSEEPILNSFYFKIKSIIG